MASQPDGAADPSLQADIRAHIRGEEQAAERLCERLAPPLRTAARRLLGDEHPDVDDVVQDSVLATLGHLSRAGAFEGDLVRFGVTVARNRCRNLLAWRSRHRHAPLEQLSHQLAAADTDPLALLLADEVDRLVQQALDSLDEACRRLLEAFYLRRESAETLRRRLGLGVLQSVYYRRNVCLDRAAVFLEKRLAFCSRPDKEPTPSPQPDQGEDP